MRCKVLRDVDDSAAAGSFNPCINWFSHFETGGLDGKVDADFLDPRWRSGVFITGHLFWLHQKYVQGAKEKPHLVTARASRIPGTKLEKDMS